MPLLSVVLYIATRLKFDGEILDEGMVKLFARAGLHFTAREILDDGVASAADTVH